MKYGTLDVERSQSRFLQSVAHKAEVADGQALSSETKQSEKTNLVGACMTSLPTRES